jgi:hypothetical protein
MANELSFITRVDLSGIKSGMEAAATVVQAGSEKMAVAMSRANLEQKALNQALKELGPLAAQGNQQAVSAIAGHIESLTAAKQAVASLNAAEAEENATLRSGIGARQAASAELRVFQGGIEGSTRAAGAFLTNVAGLGPLIEVAFPVFGAIALGEVLVDVGSKLVSFIEDAERLGQETGTNWLTGAIGQFDGLGAAVKQADAEISSLAKDMDDVAKRDRSAQIENIRLTQGAAAAYRAQANEKIKTEQGNAVIIQGLIAERSILEKRAAEDTSPNLLVANAPTTDALKAAQTLKGVKEQIVDLQSTNNTLEREALNLTLQADQVKAKSPQKSHNPAPDLMRNIEHSFAELGNIAPGEAATFWSKYIHAFDAYGDAAISEANSVLEKYNRAIQGALKQDAEPGKLGKQWAEEQEKIALIGANGEAARAGLDAVNKALKEQGEDVLRTGSRWDTYWVEVARGTETSSQAQQGLAQVQIAVELAEGHITRLAAAEQLAAAEAQAYKERLAELREELEKLRKEGVGLHPGDAGYEQNAARQQSVQNQITQVSGAAGTSAAKNQGNIAQEMAAPYLAGMNTINSAWLRTQNQLILGTRRVSQAFAEMGVSLLVTTAANFEKLAVKALSSEITQIAAHRVAEETKTTDTRVANAQRAQITGQTNLKEITSHAAAAAAGAYHAMSAIPVVGPVLGAVAAGATFAAVEAFSALAAFETGGIIPNTGVALVHQGEAVIPAPLTNFLLGAASTSNTNNSRNSVSQSNSFYGSSDAAFRRQLRRNSSDLVSSVRRGLRDQGKT